MHTCEEKDKLFTVAGKARMIWSYLPPGSRLAQATADSVSLRTSNWAPAAEPTHALRTLCPLPSPLYLINSRSFSSLRSRAASSKKPALIRFSDQIRHPSIDYD